MPGEKRRLLVTSALPYANGPIHLGHLVEHIQTDIWVRFQRLVGNECLYVCADDAHGTPTMVAARREGVSPEELIGPMNEAHRRDFAGFSISHDNYYTTHSDENRALSELIYERLREGGHIAEREVEQLYCEQDGMFLPDRFLRTTCPRCGALDQYGDSCESCGATYHPEDLADPRCAVCGSRPVQRRSLHYFIKLGDFTDVLREWVQAGHVRPEVRNKLEEWFREGLRDWDISRDAPYFGFEIPGAPGKFFYVWLDAPIGYMASTLDWCKREGREFDDYWRDPGCEIHHFIGKDILYFHTLFWPAMLMAAGFRTPTRVHVHGFLTVNGEKMSKSRGTFIRAETYLEHLAAGYLRYYLACKLGAAPTDVDLSFEDFTARVNADIVGNLVNLGSRSIRLATRHFQGVLGALDADGEALLAKLRAGGGEIAEAYDGLQYGAAMRTIAALGDEANRYLEVQRPWERVKTDRDAAHSSLSAAISAFRILVLYLKPVLPEIAATAEGILRLPSQGWDDCARDLAGHTVGEFHHLAKRVDEDAIEAMLAASAEP